MARLTPLPFDDAQQLLAPLGLQLHELEPLDAGSVNSNFRFVTSTGAQCFLRLYEEQGLDGAQQELRLLRELAALGIPVVAPLGEELIYRGKPAAVFPWVGGRSLKAAEVTPGVARRMGEALGRVHAAAVTPMPESRFRPEALYQRLTVVEESGREELAAAAQLIRRQLTEWEALPHPALPSGTIHGDLFRDNVLWLDGEISALLDFESASRGCFAFDLMVTLSAWCFGEEFDLALVEAMLGGYHQVRPLTTVERRELVHQGVLVGLRFATTRLTDFSLRVPPGERPKRDYRRFLRRAEALQSGAIDPIVAQLPG